MAGRGRSGVDFKAKAAIRRMLRELPEEATAEIAEVLEEGGDEILAAQRASARRKTGKMARALSKKFNRRGLSLKIGIVGKAASRKVFYARILGGGRKAQTVIVSRGGGHRDVGGAIAGRRERALAAGKKGVYRLRVKARAAEPVIDPARAKAARRRMLDKLSDVWKRVIAKHTPGGASGN